MSKSDSEGQVPRRVAHSPRPFSRDVPAIVGRNLKGLRKAQGHSLERLAELSGVSRAMLGQIETGKSVPTVALLWKIADALGVPVTALIVIENAASSIVLTRVGSPAALSGDGHFARRPLFSPEGPRGAEFYEVRIAPHHCEVSPPQATGTQQNLVVAKGALVVKVGEEPPIALGEGDAIQCPADVSHTLENPDESEAVAYLVLTRSVRSAG